ncbi:peptidylprolyl isomerase [Enhygromyxa salina]|uniref:peptidylprolyl isomerase n=1 Tax=Enhygromyxa salina TaxID=215803 RepID=A0A2S9XUD6_9BACT|nr:peptidylprolyl isomerase [Enhygromyxa salina]PRP96489.1 putative peptidyl-prolyl cis-trans isomerase [Enhygromyxa salina]
MFATALGLALVWGSGCQGSTSSGVSSAQQQQAPGEAPAMIDEGPGLPSWGARVPSLATDAVLGPELARSPMAPQLTGLLGPSHAEDGAGAQQRERGLWSLARIGGEEARERLLVELDRGDSLALAAAALLEVPRHDPGGAPEPLAGGPWGLLEDALWTRYAVTDPGALSHQRALLLAIARIGGARSITRLGVDLAEVPGPDHGPEVVARWSAAMQTLGIVCARGLSLEQTTGKAMSAGLQLRSGVDPAVSEAALYALSRCARSSGELLVESRELLVERLTPHVERPASPTHAMLAWRSFAALGELPESIPAGILARTDAPSWEVEVEAARALGGDPRGAASLRERLAALPIESFSGPRQHVLIVGLQAMRGGVAAAASEFDPALVELADQLVIGRRSEDPRLRKASALALCELRLLQAIRSGRIDALTRCHELDGAPAVELPISLLVNLEVEALLRATRADAPGTSNNLGTAEIDDEAVIADRVDDAPHDPGRQARIARLLELARASDPARATPALHALAEIDDPSVLPALRVALLSPDPGVLAAAATAIAVRSVDASKRDLEVVTLLEELVVQRSKPAELEARLAGIEALGALARNAVASIDPNPAAASAPGPAPTSPWLARTILPLAADPHVAVRRQAREALLGHEQLLLEFDLAERSAAPTRLSAFGERVASDVLAYLAGAPVGLRVVTSAGSFTIAFTGVEAPINQSNLVALADAGFYDGLGFHRVVPGFVVQGGDPRGDGYGGPGYVVPCEWSNLRYERGTVGIALAGKDTGGSQFFVTQTAQPHLDARYTVVGQISEGLEVVDSLLPGDHIESVRVLYASADRSEGQ